MGRQEVTKVEKFCDRCGRVNNYLTVCIVCGQEYCLICDGATCNALSQNICRDCIEREDVQMILRDYLENEFRPLKERQKKEISDLPGKHP